MHPSPASNALNRRSFTAYSAYFQEERRRLLEEPIVGENDRPRKIPRISHPEKINFRELSNMIASNWKSLDTHQKEMYGKIATAKKREYDACSNSNKAAQRTTPMWKNHVKTNHMVAFDSAVGSPVLIEEEVVEQVVEDVLAELEEQDSVSTNTTAASTLTNPDGDDPPVFWPLMGPKTPIADFIRNQCYPQHALECQTTCLPCTVSTPTTTAGEVKLLADSLDEGTRAFCLRALLRRDSTLSNDDNEGENM